MYTVRITRISLLARRNPISPFSVREFPSTRWVFLVSTKRIHAAYSPKNDVARPRLPNQITEQLWNNPCPPQGDPEIRFSKETREHAPHSQRTNFPKILSRLAPNLTIRVRQIFRYTRTYPRLENRNDSAKTHGHSVWLSIGKRIGYFTPPPPPDENSQTNKTYLLIIFVRTVFCVRRDRIVMLQPHAVSSRLKPQLKRRSWFGKTPPVFKFTRNAP